MKTFDGYLTRQAYPFDLIFFSIPEKYKTKWHDNVVGVQTNWERKTNPVSYGESDRKPTLPELAQYVLKAVNEVKSGIVRVLDGTSYRGLTHSGHTIMLNNYKFIDITSNGHPDLYFEISQMIRRSPHDKFGHPDELDKLTEILKRENLI